LILYFFYVILILELGGFMKHTIKIKEIVEQIIVRDHQPLFFNLSTYKIVRGKTPEFHKHPEHYISLPDQTDINLSELVNKFLMFIDEATANQIRSSLKNKFTMDNFLKTLNTLDLIEDWEQFKFEEYSNYIIKWCKANNITYSQ